MPKNDFTRKIKDFDTFAKLPNNVGNLGKLIVAKGFKKWPKVQKSPNLVTLDGTGTKAKVGWLYTKGKQMITIDL